MKVDKAKVIDEVWTLARIRSFLQHGDDSAATGGSYPLLLRAYQAMRPGDFEQFLNDYRAAGGHLDHRGPDGRTLVEYVGSHRHGEPFAELLRAAQQ